MERFDHDRRSQRGASSLRFRAAPALGFPDHLHVASSKQFEDALVEAEVADRILNLSVFNVPKPVASEASEKSGAGIDPADVPKTTHQQTALHRCDHFL